MARRKRYREAENAEVPMSPLIDCVFLLLIFFLVTTMIKRKDKLIPIQLPDMDSMLSVTQKEDVTVLGLSEEGEYSLGVKDDDPGSSRAGAMLYRPLGDLQQWLSKQLKTQGDEFLMRPIRIDADRSVRFQRAVDMIDILKIAGFTDVGIKTKKRAIGK